MRWKLKERGSKRTRRIFLLVPKKIHNEYRWLEIATWEDRWCLWGERGYWVSHRWVDDEERA